MTTPARKGRGLSQTRTVHDRLRGDILTGRLPPGSKLNIAALAEQLSVSVGAVREGLAMLEADAWVVSEPQKGFRVSLVSAADSRQLVQARIAIEKLCLAEAIRYGDLAWEGQVVSAAHKLSRLPERDPSNPSILNAEWAASHAVFHRALVAGCPNMWLLRMHDMLYRHSERYRQLSAPKALDRDVAGEHDALVEAMLNRDVRRAEELIESHLQVTANLVEDSLPMEDEIP